MILISDTHAHSNAVRITHTSSINTDESVSKLKRKREEEKAKSDRKKENDDDEEDSKKGGGWWSNLWGGGGSSHKEEGDMDFEELTDFDDASDEKKVRPSEEQHGNSGRTGL